MTNDDIAGLRFGDVIHNTYVGLLGVMVETNPPMAVVLAANPEGACRDWGIGRSWSPNLISGAYVRWDHPGVPWKPSSR